MTAFTDRRPPSGRAAPRGAGAGNAGPRGPAGAPGPGRAPVPGWAWLTLGLGGGLALAAAFSITRPLGHTGLDAPGTQLSAEEQALEPADADKGADGDRARAKNRVRYHLGAKPTEVVSASEDGAGETTTGVAATSAAARARHAAAASAGTAPAPAPGLPSGPADTVATGPAPSPLPVASPAVPGGDAIPPDEIVQPVPAGTVPSNRPGHPLVPHGQTTASARPPANREQYAFYDMLPSDEVSVRPADASATDSAADSASRKQESDRALRRQTETNPRASDMRAPARLAAADAPAVPAVAATPATGSAKRDKAPAAVLAGRDDARKAARASAGTGAGTGVGTGATSHDDFFSEKTAPAAPAPKAPARHDADANDDLMRVARAGEARVAAHDARRDTLRVDAEAKRARVLVASAAATPAPALAAARAPALRAERATPAPPVTPVRNTPVGDGLGEGRYVIQVAAYPTLANAESHRSELARLGVPARVETSQHAGHTWYRVRLGPFRDAQARDTLQRLKGGGVSGVLMPVRGQTQP